ncbi:hypothetical protein CXF59_11935 [Flavobacterium sp. ALD4]|uniref:hypothetical protein n=1 Tax=Flavobacterium sp. ALD4 TaxID=2058314 RepID=UPI000C32F7AD|nr:hypothetical protein [Flavobacterium sp. ALD4]PKH66637.1 hypothetical protein CXF59_11935 [Flavobacterium sp. ALD4]
MKKVVIGVVRFYEYPNLETPTKPLAPIEVETLVHSILFFSGRKERPEEAPFIALKKTVE